MTKKKALAIDETTEATAVILVIAASYNIYNSDSIKYAKVWIFSTKKNSANSTLFSGLGPITN